MNAKISIIIPVYNVEKYLDKCLSSVISQTYKNIEIIVVNDGSPDNSDLICQEYAQKDSRIIYIKQENKGVSAARNVALDVATGDFITFVDSDDFVDNQFIEKYYSAIENTGTDIAIFSMYENVNGKFTKYTITDKNKMITSHQAILDLVQDYNIKSYLWDKIFKKSLFDNLRFEENRTYEDLLIMYKLFERARSIYYSTDAYYYYNLSNEGSITQNKNINSTLSRYQNLMYALRTRALNFKHKDKEIYKATLLRIISSSFEYIALTYKTKNLNIVKEQQKYLRSIFTDVIFNKHINNKFRMLMIIYTLPLPLLGIYLDKVSHNNVALSE